MDRIGKPSIVAVLRHYGADEFSLPSPASGWRPCRCPFHDDTNPSASVNTTLEAFKCHSCGIAGDSWSIIQDREGVNFTAAIGFAESIFNYESGDLRKPARHRKPYRPSWS